MGRTAASIQLEIDALEEQVVAASRAQSYALNGRSKTNQNIEALTKRLDILYQQLDRVNGTAPMFVRGRIRNL